MESLEELLGIMREVVISTPDETLLIESLASRLPVIKHMTLSSLIVNVLSFELNQSHDLDLVPYRSFTSFELNLTHDLDLVPFDLSINQSQASIA